MRTVPRCDNPVDPLDLAQLPVPDHLAHFAVNTVGALIEHHGKQAIRSACRLVQLLDLLVKHLVLFQRINDREVAVLIVEASRILPAPDLKSDLIEILAQSNAARGISTTWIRFAVEPIQAAIVIGEPNKLFHFAATENVLRSANVLRLGAQTVCRYFLQKLLRGFDAVILACHIAVSFSL